MANPFPSLVSLPTNVSPRFVDPPREYLCCLCDNVLRGPIQTRCGHRTCLQCMTNYLAQHEGHVMCPENEDDCESVEMTNIAPDYATKQCLEKIAVYCTNRGCAEEMPWKLLEQHLEECPFRQQQSERAPAGVEERIAVLEKKWRRLELALGQLCIELRTATQENRKKIAELMESETSFDGTLVWKISSYAEKKARERVLHSRVFYTDRFGYKLSLICYPDGDGTGKSTHLSLFLVVMRGEFDDILRWPLRARVRFEAMSRQGGKIIDVFTTDTSLKSFARPTSESNLGAGCPRFVDKERLESSCLVDDAIFLRAKVEPID